MKTKPLDFGIAFKYPFNRKKGLWNILWILVPIYGWLALSGYGIRIINEFLKGKFKQLPKMHTWSDFKLGCVMLLKSIPFIIVYGVLINLGSILLDFVWTFSGNLINIFFSLFILPILGINFFKKQTVSSYFEFSLIKYVFNNFGDYIIALLKSICLGIIFLIMIIILVGLPAGQFTKSIFLADFYRRNVK